MICRPARAAGILKIGRSKMRMQLFTAIATTMLVGLALSSAPALAKTGKECLKEWRADKAAMQAAGKTEKAYVAECSGKAAKPAAAPAKEGSGGGGKY
jgi:hypothetical protein